MHKILELLGEVEKKMKLIKTVRSDTLRGLPREYCIAHVSWDVTGYQGLFCPSNKPFCGR